MKTQLDKLISHGSRFGKHTGYHTWPGFIVAHFTDGTKKYLGDISINEALERLQTLRVECTEFNRKRARARQVRKHLTSENQ
jgi:hypothetical protein